MAAALGPPADLSGGRPRGVVHACRGTREDQQRPERSPRSARAAPRHPLEPGLTCRRARAASMRSTSRSWRRCSAKGAAPSRNWRTASGFRRGPVLSGCAGSRRPASSSATRRCWRSRSWRSRSPCLPRSLESHGRQDQFERRLAAIEEVVECWEVSGAFDYLARVVCADVARYETLTSDLIDDPKLGVARVVSIIALRPVRRFAGYPVSLLTRKPG